MDMSPALTSLPETYKPVTAASVNHYPATLYLVHICRFTGLWNVFSERHWSNSGPIKLRCRAASCAKADRPQSNGIIKSDKWQSANADSKTRSCLRVWVWLNSYSDAWLIQGFWTQYNNESKGSWRSDFTHYSDKPVQCGSSCGVVGAIMTWWCLVIFPGLIAFCVECCSLRIQGPNRLEKGNKEIRSFSKAICSFLSVQVKECFPSKQPKRNCIGFPLTQLHSYT